MGKAIALVAGVLTIFTVWAIATVAVWLQSIWYPAGDWFAILGLTPLVFGWMWVLSEEAQWWE